MNKEQLEKIKQDLIQRRKEILKDLDDISQVDTNELDNRNAKFPEYGDKPDENAQEMSDYSTNVVAERVLEKSLEEIEVALDRIDKGEYHVCKYCKGDIGDKRLIARPTATSCIDCKKSLQDGNL